jgi:hypothetical protein
MTREGYKKVNITTPHSYMYVNVIRKREASSYQKVIP